MARALVLLALGFVLNGSAAHGSAHRELTYAALRLPSFGIVGTAETKSCGAACSQSVSHLFVGSGRSWREITPPRMLFELEDVQFASRMVGWVVENDCAQGKAYVDRTRDGGRSWDKAAVGSTNCAAGSRLNISFADRRHGWLLDVYENGSGPYPLERTLDGGATWRPVGRVPIAGRIAFRTAREGWLSRADFAQPQQLYATMDSGRTWQRKVVPVPPGWAGAHLYPDVPAFFGRRGVLPMSLTRAGHAAVAFYVTADAGRTWSIASIRLVASAVSRSHSPFVAYVPTGIVSATTWWVAGVGARARIAVTTDAGKTWNAVTPTGLPSLRAPTISAVDDRHAWLINLADGRLAAYSTTDAGRRWRRLSLPEN